MIHRVVKLTFQEDKIEDFLAIFQASKEKIVAQEGCHAVDLLQVEGQPHIFFTYSFWDDEEALNSYRHSALFQQTWAKTKVLFADKPAAWSTQLVDKAVCKV